MGINNRKRRAEKKAKRNKKTKVRRNTAKRENSFAPVFYEMPNPFGHLTEDQRKKAITEIAQKSEQVVRESLAKLKQLVTTNDPLTLLSILALYGRSSSIGENGFTKKDSDFEITQAQIEFLQAVTLQIAPEDLQRQPYNPHAISELWSLLPEIMTAHRYRGLDKISFDAPDDEKAVGRLQELIRGHTQAVRNWGYFSQVSGIAAELYTVFDSSLVSEYGFSVSSTIQFFKYLIKQVDERSSARFENLRALYRIKNKRAMVQSYYALVGGQESDKERFINGIGIDTIATKALFGMLMAHYDLSLHEIYIFTHGEIQRALDIDDGGTRKLVDCFSYGWGDLSSFPEDHLFLANPVWIKPIIAIDRETSFCPMPHLFFSFVIPALESLIEKIDKEGLNRRRAKYLEEKIVEIIKRRFPEVATLTGLQWTLGDTRYETDVITFIDSHALIVEAKSGRISGSAMRGAPDRLKRHVKEILLDPNEQSKRLQERLYELIRDPSIVDELRSQLPVSLTNIHKIIRVSVSLEDFAMLQANVSQLKNTGWLPNEFAPCPTMNLADFETLFDFLEHPVQIIHYLQRRQELEGTMGYMADELDLMGAYVSTLFNFGDFEEDLNFAFVGMSADIDNYYNSRDAGVSIPKPRPKISSLFSRIFKQIEARKLPRWTEIGALLNRYSPDDQRKLEQMLVELKLKVQKDWRTERHKNMLIYSPPKASEHALAFVVFKNGNAEKRHDYMNHAAEQAMAPGHVKQCLVVAINMDDETKVYQTIAMYE